MTFSEEELRALVMRAMDGAQAAERERWATVCEMLIAMQPTGVVVTPVSVLTVLARRMRENNGPQLPPEARERLLSACYAGAKVEHRTVQCPNVLNARTAIAARCRLPIGHDSPCDFRSQGGKLG